MNALNKTKLKAGVRRELEREWYHRDGPDLSFAIDPEEMCRRVYDTYKYKGFPRTLWFGPPASFFDLSVAWTWIHGTIRQGRDAGVRCRVCDRAVWAARQGTHHLAGCDCTQVRAERKHGLTDLLQYGAWTRLALDADCPSPETREEHARRERKVRVFNRHHWTPIREKLREKWASEESVARPDLFTRRLPALLKSHACAAGVTEPSCHCQKNEAGHANTQPAPQ